MGDKTCHIIFRDYVSIIQIILPNISIYVKVNLIFETVFIFPEMDKIHNVKDIWTFNHFTLTWNSLA